MSAAEIMISTAIKFVLDPQGRVFQRKIKPPNTVQCDRAITGSSKMLISLHLGCVCPSVTLISFLADEFSIAAITSYRKFNGLKQDTFITAQLFRSEVRHNSHQAKIKVLTGLFFFFFSLSLLVLEASGKVSFLAILFIETNHVPWFLSTAATEND